MRRDMVALKSAIQDKIRRSTFSAIVMECFIGALPFDEININDKRNLAVYISDVLESLTNTNGVSGGFSILEKNIAIETNPAKKQFFSKVYDICNEAAITAAERIVKNEEGSERSLDDILNNSGLNNEEIESFKDNVKTLNINNMKNIIQKKVIDTIKSEQEQQKEAAELNRQLRDAITPDPSPEELEEREKRLSGGITDEEIQINDTEESEDFFDDEDDKMDLAKEGFINYIKESKEKHSKYNQAFKKLQNMDDNEFMKVLAEFMADTYGTRTEKSASMLQAAFDSHKADATFFLKMKKSKTFSTEKGVPVVVAIAMDNTQDGNEYFITGYYKKNNEKINLLSWLTKKGPERGINVSLASWYEKKYFLAPIKESYMPATEGFLSNWNAKRLSRKMDMSDINRLDMSAFCELVAEYAADTIDLNYAINDPVLLEKLIVSTVWKDVIDIDLEKIAKPTIIVHRVGIMSVATFGYYDPIQRKEYYGFGFQNNTGANLDEFLNPCDTDISRCSIKVKSKEWWVKKLLEYYQINYKDKISGVADEAMTKFFQRNFTVSEPLEPITFFSRLQDYALEAYRTSIADDDSISEIPYNSLYRTTFQSGLPLIHKKFTLEEATESLIIAAEAINLPVNGSTKEDFDKSMIISTCIYTVLETLKTIGLYNPSYQDMRRFISTGTSYDDSSKMEIAKENVKREIKAIESMLRTYENLDMTRADTATESLDFCLEHLHILNQSGYKFIEEISTIRNLKEKIRKKTKISDYIATEATIEAKKISLKSAIMGMNKLNRYYGSKPNVTSIEIYYNSATEGMINDVVVRGMNGSIIDKSFLDILDKNQGIAIENVLKESYHKSELFNSSKSVKIIDMGKANKTISLSR